MTVVLGVAAALAAPFVMTIGFLVWEDHWRGSAFALNLFKCNFVIPFSFVMVVISRPDDFFPKEVFSTRAVGYLMLSSAIGIVIGDWTWLKGLQILGARKVILVDALKPFFAAFLGWILLEEDLRVTALGGIVLTVAGVLIVSLEKESTDEDGLAGTNNLEASQRTEPVDSELVKEEESCLEDPRDPDCCSKPNNPDAASPNIPKQAIASQRTGYALAIVNVALDTYGSVLTKQHGKEMTVWEINLIRFGFAGVVMMSISLLLHVVTRIQKLKNDPMTASCNTIAWYALPISEMKWSSWLRVSIGVLLVTFLTPALSNYALFKVVLALALTLTSVGPIYSLPLAYQFQGEVPTGRSLLGALLAVGGVAVLAFWGV